MSPATSMGEEGATSAWIERDQRVAVRRPLAQAPRRGPCARLSVFERVMFTAPDDDALHLEIVNRALRSHTTMRHPRLARMPDMVDTTPATAVPDSCPSASSVTHGKPRRPRRGRGKWA